MVWRLCYSDDILIKKLSRTNILSISVFDSKYRIGFGISTPASPIRNTSACQVKINKEQDNTEVHWWESGAVSGWVLLLLSKLYFILSAFVGYALYLPFQKPWKSGLKEWFNTPQSRGNKVKKIPNNRYQGNR